MLGPLLGLLSMPVHLRLFLETLRLLRHLGSLLHLMSLKLLSLLGLTLMSLLLRYVRLRRQLRVRLFNPWLLRLWLLLLVRG